MEAIVFLGIGAALGIVFGWAAFFMGLNANNRLSRLEREIAALKRTAHGGATPDHQTTEEAPIDVAPVRAAPDAVPDEEPSEPPESEPWRAPPTKQTADADGKRAVETLSGALTGNWLIWLGGAALALGGAFLVKAAADAGFFGPVMRVGAALVAGAAMIGAAQWMRLGGAPAKSLAPPVLSGAGAATIYGAIFAAYELYDLIPALVAFLLLAGVSAALVVLAVIHRRQAMAALAIIGAHLSPVIAGSGGPPGAPFYLYILAICAGGLVTAQFMRWRPVSWLSLAGGLFWPLLVILFDSIGSLASIATYLPLLVILAAAVVWESAAEPVDIGRIRKSGLTLSQIVFSVALAGALAAAFLLTLSEGWSPTLAVMWAAFAVLSLVGARLRKGFSLAPTFVAVGFAAALAFAEAPQTFPRVEFAAGIAGLFAVGGYVVMRGIKETGPAALASAFGPALILCGLFYAVGAFEQAPRWGYGAILIAFFNISVLAELYRRRGGFDAAPGAASAYCLGASLATTLAVAMSLDGLAMSFGFAIQAPVIAWLWRRFRLPALQFAASALAALGALRLLFLPEVLQETVGATPIVNLLLLSYLAPSAGFWLAARWFEGGGLSKRGGVVQGMEAAAISLFAVFVSLEIRHLYHHGDIAADYDSLFEITLQSISWALMGAFLRWRFGDYLTPIRSIAEKGLVAIAAAQTAMGALFVMNPWWGDEPVAIAGAAVINALAFYYLAPAAAFALAAYVARRNGWLLQSRMAGMLAVLLAYVWCILSVRHQFHTPDLSAGRISDAESWGYTIVTILFATAMLVAAAFRRSAMLRLGGLGVLMLAVAKVFIFDLAGLEGVWRATSFLGLGAALVGIAVLYQRVLAPMMTLPPEKE